MSCGYTILFATLTVFTQVWADDPTDSKVILLNDSNIAMINEGQWLVEFYAPWCGHCKKLAPVYDQVAEHMDKVRKSKGGSERGSISLAKVNCDDFSGICSSAGVSGYPTIKYYVDGVPKAYRGGRSFQDFIDYADKMTKPAVSKITALSLEKVKKDPLVSFLLVKPQDSSDFVQVEEIYKAVAKVMLDYNSPNFLQIDDNKAVEKELGYVVTTPSIFVMQSGDILAYTGSMAEESILAWVKLNQFPYVTQLNEYTFDTVTNQDRKLVVGVVDSSNPASVKFSDNLKSVAKVNKNFIFSIIDGVNFARWVVNYGIEAQHLPTIFVLDMPNEEHYSDLDIKFTDSTKIEQFLENVQSGELPPQVTSYITYYSNKISRGFQAISDTLTEHKLASLAALGTSVLVFVFVCLIGRNDNNSPPPQQASNNNKKKSSKSSSKSD